MRCRPGISELDDYRPPTGNARRSRRARPAADGPIERGRHPITRAPDRRILGFRALFLCLRIGSVGLSAFRSQSAETSGVAETDARVRYRGDFGRARALAIGGAAPVIATCAISAAAVGKWPAPVYAPCYPCVMIRESPEGCSPAIQRRWCRGAGISRARRRLAKFIRNT